MTFDAVVLAGGRGRRLGGVSKPEVRLAGRTLLTESTAGRPRPVDVAGMVLLAFSSGWLFIVGALLGYLGWTWPGLVHLAVVRDSPGAVAANSGTVQSGFSGGAAIGPLLLGVLVEATS